MKHDARRDSVIGLLGVLVFAAGCGDGVTPPSEIEEQLPEEAEEVFSHDATVLSALGGLESNAWTINNAGVVAGWSNVHGGRALRWAGNEVLDLLGEWSGARGMNDAGSIAGYYSRDGRYQAYVLQDGVLTDLEPMDPVWHDDWTFAWGINEGGTVVGVSTGRVAVWKPATGGGYEPPLSLHLSLSGSERVQVNARGDVAFTSRGNGWPVMWIAQPDGGYGEPLWLGRPAEGAYSVRGINDAGVVVGAMLINEVPTALAWLPGSYDQPIQLGAGEAWDINRHGQIVGATGGALLPFNRGPLRPALWTLEPDGSVTGPDDLGTPSGFAFGGARAINDHGWIVGSCWGHGAVALRAILWTPKE